MTALEKLAGRKTVFYQVDLLDKAALQSVFDKVYYIPNPTLSLGGVCCTVNNNACLLLCVWVCDDIYGILLFTRKKENSSIYVNISSVWWFE